MQGHAQLNGVKAGVLNGWGFSQSFDSMEAWMAIRGQGESPWGHIQTGHVVTLGDPGCSCLTAATAQIQHFCAGWKFSRKGLQT